MTVKKKAAPKYDLTQPTVTVALKHPFLHGATQVRSITLRTACYVADMEEMDEATGLQERFTRLVSALSDVERNGKGIPHTVLSEKLRAIDFITLRNVAGDIMIPDEEDESAADEPKKSGETIHAIGGTSQQ